MGGFIIFLAGTLVGGLGVYALVTRAERYGLKPHHLDPHFLPAARAVTEHLKVHGTINLTQAERLLSVHSMTAMRYLNQMEQDGLVQSQGHRGGDEFYTRA